MKLDKAIARDKSREKHEKGNSFDETQKRYDNDSYYRSKIHNISHNKSNSLNNRSHNSLNRNSPHKNSPDKSSPGKHSHSHSTRSPLHIKHECEIHNEEYYYGKQG